MVEAVAFSDLFFFALSPIIPLHLDESSDHPLYPGLYLHLQARYDLSEYSEMARMCVGDGAHHIGGMK